ncbi:calcium/sodium antiporter [Patescibacteria group bacterium]
MVIVWILVFIASIALLVKSADWVVENAEKIGLAMKISPFIIGVTIVAIGTSFPELVTSLVAVYKGATEIVAANALGSGVANILLIVGISAVVAKKLIIRRSLIDLDSPLLAASAVLFLFVMWDQKVVFLEGLLLTIAFIIYLLYTVSMRTEEEPDEDTPEIVEVLPSRLERRRMKVKEIEEKKSAPLGLKFNTFAFLGVGIVGLTIGGTYSVEAILKLSGFFNISTSLITLTAMSVGTSLPDFIVSVRSAWKKKYEIALGNIFGSNIFLALIVLGFPALLKTITVDDLTFTIGLPFFVVATLLFVISGISRRIHMWEGLMYILIYILFLGKLLGLI